MTNHEGVMMHGESMEHKPTPEDVRLGNGDPLYYVLLDQNGAGVVNAADSQRAHDELRAKFAVNPEAVLACEGKTQDEALEILNGIEPLKEAA